MSKIDDLPMDTFVSADMISKYGITHDHFRVLYFFYLQDTREVPLIFHNDLEFYYFVCEQNINNETLQTFMAILNGFCCPLDKVSDELRASRLVLDMVIPRLNPRFNKQYTNELIKDLELKELVAPRIVTGGMVN